MFQSQVSQIEADLKTKAQAYNALKTSLQTMEKKQTGSLMTRHLVIFIWVLIFCFCAMLLNYMNNALLLGKIIESEFCIGLFSSFSIIVVVAVAEVLLWRHFYNFVGVLVAVYILNCNR